jgi:hypothetical protein
MSNGRRDASRHGHRCFNEKDPQLGIYWPRSFVLICLWRRRRRFITTADGQSTAVPDAYTYTDTNSDADSVTYSCADTNAVAHTGSDAVTDAKPDADTSADLWHGRAAIEYDLCCPGPTEVRYRGGSGISKRLIRHAHCHGATAIGFRTLVRH